jgi:formamidopyrimidine-DNA glycosylase
MPELPEVEIVRRGLDARVRGARIEKVQVLWPPFVAATPTKIHAAVIGHRIGAARRRGKLLILDLNQDFHLLVHLMMTGQVVVHRRGRPVLAGGHPTSNILGPMPNRWTRAVFALSGSRTLFVNDSRKFGRIRVVSTAELAADPFLRHVGPEPLADDFTVAVFQGRLARHRSAPVKAALLDQTTVAGLGNIYADECLHVARIDPRQPTASITSAQSRRLHDAIQTVLREAIEYGGTSFASYVDEAGHREAFLAHARLFGRQGLPCVVCGTSIERIRVAGRSTNYCPHCQRMSDNVGAQRGYRPMAVSARARAR